MLCLFWSCDRFFFRRWQRCRRSLCITTSGERMEIELNVFDKQDRVLFLIIHSMKNNRYLHWWRKTCRQGMGLGLKRPYYYVTKLLWIIYSFIYRFRFTFLRTTYLSFGCRKIGLHCRFLELYVKMMLRKWTFNIIQCFGFQLLYLILKNCVRT